VPYISALKVGSLGAITTNTGALSVTGDLSMSGSSAIKVGTWTGYSWPGHTGTGFYLSAGGLLMGDETNHFELGASGDIYAPQFTIISGAATFAGTLQVGSSPVRSGTTMTGSGAVIYSDGKFSIGNATKNFTFDGSTFTINGDLVATGNIVANAVSTFAMTTNSGSTSVTSSSYTEIDRVSYGPYSYAVDVLVTVTAKLEIDASGTGPYNAWMFAQLVDNASGASLEAKEGNIQISSLNTVSLVWSHTLAASTSGYTKLMAKVPAGYAPTTLSNIQMVATVHKR
jgi:hypothetical protein